MVKITIDFNPDDKYECYCAYHDWFGNFEEYEEYHKECSPSGYVIDYSILKKAMNTTIAGVNK